MTIWWAYRIIFVNGCSSSWREFWVERWRSSKIRSTRNQADCERSYQLLVYASKRTGLSGGNITLCTVFCLVTVFYASSKTTSKALAGATSGGYNTSFFVCRFWCWRNGIATLFWYFLQGWLNWTCGSWALASASIMWWNVDKSTFIKLIYFVNFCLKVLIVP